MRQLFPPPLNVFIWFCSHQMMVHPVVASAEVNPIPGGRHPVIQAKKEGCLNDCLVKSARGLGVCPLPPQNSGEKFLYNLSLPSISNYHRPVFIRCGKDPPKVFKFRHRLQRSSVGLEVHRHARLCLVLPQPLDFPLRHLGAHCRGLMIHFHLLPGNKHIVFRAAQEGLIPLLQDH